MVAIFIDSIDGNSEKQIFTWKEKPFIHALILTKIKRSLDGLYLGDKKDIYKNAILQGLNKYMPTRRHSGESNDDVKKWSLSFPSWWIFGVKVSFSQKKRYR
jgi:hypothetical protein